MYHKYPILSYLLLSLILSQPPLPPTSSSRNWHCKYAGHSFNDCHTIIHSGLIGLESGIGKVRQVLNGNVPHF